MIHPKYLRGLLALALVLAAATVVHASGAGFTLSAEGTDLGKPDESGEVPRYRAKLEVGRTVTLVAQGVLVPRGGPAEPGEPDAAAWLFDDAALQIVPHDKKKYDKTKVAVALKALKAGQTRVRFVGNILGREQKYDVLLDVVEAKE